MKYEDVKGFEILFIITNEKGQIQTIDIPNELKAELSDRLFEELLK